MTATPKVALVGAGSSGIAAAKALHERSLDFDVFEKSDRVGGNWVFGNKNGMSAAYRYLHINTSRERMQYSDFPMPESYPDFPRHDQIAKYFDDYVEHFGFRDRIRFETGVERAERLPDGTWEVSTDTGDTGRYDMLLVANGHHWDKRWPEPAFPGSDEFEGVQMHAHDYVDNESMKDLDVVVLGMGNSAMDISVEASEVAANTYLAARRGAWIVPKYLFGKPLDTLATSPRVPMAIGARMLEKIVTLHVGRPEKFGLPKPDHRMGQAHPTVSGRIHDRIQHGKVTPKPNIARLHRDEVEFADGTRVHADVVVYCTGYKITFPFFDETFISAPDNHIELFWRVFEPSIPNLAFIGLLQPLGAIMPLAEAQGQWVAEYARGEYHLPSPQAMREHIAKDMEAMRKRYVSSKRHTIQVDFDEYLFKLAGERREGAARAAQAGFVPQVAGRVAEGVAA
ncbi:MAG TPA: NAD(P)-binding domain-containing protein [Solirubrobacteraceae bacterium]|jgi:cation diffusion facilitator CzcD-associated flavoprotein CzcO